MNDNVYSAHEQYVLLFCHCKCKSNVYIHIGLIKLSTVKQAIQISTIIICIKWDIISQIIFFQGFILGRL